MSADIARPRMPGVGAWAVILLLLLAVGAGAEEDPADVERRLKDVRDKIEEARQLIESSRQDKDQLLEQLADAERAIGLIGRRVRDIEREITETNDRLDELGVAEARLAEELGDQRSALIGQIRAAFMMGRQQQLKLALNQESVATIGRVSTYFDYLNRARADRIGFTVSKLEELAQVRAETEDARARLEALHRRSSDEIVKRQARLKERQQLLAAIDRRIQQQGVDLERLASDETELNKLLTALRDAFSDIPGELGADVAFSSLRGKLTWPVRGTLIESFGQQRSSGVRTDGVLIAAATGTEVRAVSYGRVAFADWLRGYGLIAILDHGDGYLTLYGHVDSLYKEVGEWVQAGEVIASVGASGGRDRAALYFGLRQNSRPVNPGGWFAGDL